MQSNESILLARIDERTKSIEKKVLDLDSDIKEVRAKMNEDSIALKKDLNENYVNRHQFNPVQRAVFTAISVIVLGVLAAILNLIIPKT